MLRTTKFLSTNQALPLNSGKSRKQSGLLVTFFLSILLSYPNLAAACSCLPPEEPVQELRKSDVVFVGNVERVGSDPFKPGLKEISLKLSRSLKGLEDLGVGDNVVIYTSRDSASCGYDFAKNIDYLVYATGSRARLKVSLCSRTSYFDTSRKEVKELSNFLTENPEEASAGAREDEQEKPAVEQTNLDKQVMEEPDSH